MRPENVAIIRDCAAINRLDLRFAATHVRSPEYSPEAPSAVGGVLSTPGRSTSQKPVAASFMDPVPGSRSLAVREAWTPRAGALFASAIACVVLPRLLWLCLRDFFLISSPRFCFRDVARASVSALTAPTNVGRKRILLSSEWISFRDAAIFIAEARPELKGRLTLNADSFPLVGKTLIDNTRAKEVLGIKEFIPWKQTLLDTVDDLLKLEKEWAEQK